MKNIIKFVGNLQGSKLLCIATTFAGETVLTRLGIESNWDWGTDTVKSFHAASRLYHIS